MSRARKITWPGKSGKEYEYQIYGLEGSLKAEPGNYIFAKETKAKHWKPCYIGQTENLQERVRDHKTDGTKWQGATHIHAHINTVGEEARRAEEADLIKKWNPPGNKQLRRLKRRVP